MKNLQDKLYETKILKHEEIDTNLTVHLSKRKKNIILSTLHPSIDAQKKKTAEII